jgi:hypothetical protein
VIVQRSRGQVAQWSRSPAGRGVVYEMASTKVVFVILVAFVVFVPERQAVAVTAYVATH